MTDALSSIAGVVDVDVVRGARAPADSAPDLVIEIPHGATTTADFTSLEAQLRSPLPDALVDFFHVNTDAGAPELAVAVAHRLVALEPARSVAILRCRVPRCNNLRANHRGWLRARSVRDCRQAAAWRSR